MYDILSMSFQSIFTILQKITSLEIYAMKYLHQEIIANSTYIIFTLYFHMSY